MQQCIDSSISTSAFDAICEDVEAARAALNDQRIVCVPEVMHPPAKRVRFSMLDDVFFSGTDDLAPQTLEDFIADVDVAAPRQADVAQASLLRRS